jgi:hypothetical protein
MEDQVIDGTWGAFPGRAVTTKAGAPLHYYKDWDTQVTDLAGLMQNKDGKCMAWTKFFLDALAKQGVNKPGSYVVITAKPMNVPGFSDPGLVIDYWDFNGAGSNTDRASNGTYPYYNTYPADGQIMKKDADGVWSYNWGDHVDVADSAGIPGQNTSNPHSLFMDHVVAKLNGKHYDPSYGRLWNSLQHFDDSAVAGFYAAGQLFPGTANNKTVYAFRQNPSGPDLNEKFWTYNSATGQLQQFPPPG